MNSSQQEEETGGVVPRRIPRREELAGRIQDYILESGLVSGDELPFEGELASRFGVSRTLIRESLRMLEAMKIVETLHGKRAYVREPRIVPTIEQVILKYRSDNTMLRSLAEARFLIEVGAVEFAVQRVKPQHLERMADNLRRQNDALRQERWDRGLDTEFHLAYLSASENPLVSAWGNVVAEFFSREVPILRGPGFDRATVQEHTEIFNTLKARDIEGLRRAVRRHLQIKQAALLARYDGSGQ